MEHDILAPGYDAVYAAMPRSPTLQQLWRRHAAGRDFPEAFGHISFVTLSALRRMAAELRLGSGQTLLDLGCGMGGPALWVARETGARLLGIDFSPVAIAQATARAAELGLAERAHFFIATFSDTALPDASIDAAMSEDALQYAPDKRAAMLEAARVLRPGARFVFTAFELEPERARILPVLGSDPVEDYRPLLKGAGFSVDAYEETRGWRERLKKTYEAVAAGRDALTQEMGQAAAGALLMEVTLTLERQPYRRRVFACATRR